MHPSLRDRLRHLLSDPNRTLVLLLVWTLAILAAVAARKIPFARDLFLVLLWGGVGFVEGVLLRRAVDRWRSAPIVFRRMGWVPAPHLQAIGRTQRTRRIHPQGTADLPEHVDIEFTPGLSSGTKKPPLDP